MRRLAALVVAAVTLVGLLPATAHAQKYFGGFAGYSYGDAAGACPSLWSDCPTRRTGYGIVTGSINGVFGMEGEYAWTPDFFTPQGDVKASRVTTLMGTMLVGAPIGPLHPYGALGIGLTKTTIEFVPQNLAEYSDTAFGWNYGLGMIIMLPAHLGVRLDWRRMRSSTTLPVVGPDLRPDNSLQFSRASIAIVLH